MSKYFKPNPKPLSYLNLILYMVKSSRLFSFDVFDTSKINEQSVYIKFYLKLGKMQPKPMKLLKLLLGTILWAVQRLSNAVSVLEMVDS